MELRRVQKRGRFLHPSLHSQSNVDVHPFLPPSITSSVNHRYSRLHQFHRQIRHLLPRGFPPFPPKQFGAKSNFDPAYLRMRCVSLTTYFRSLLSLPNVPLSPRFSLDLLSPGVSSPLRPRGRRQPAPRALSARLRLALALRRRFHFSGVGVNCRGAGRRGGAVAAAAAAAGAGGAELRAGGRDSAGGTSQGVLFEVPRRVGEVPAGNRCHLARCGF